MDLFEPEPEPRLIHRITGGAFANDPFLPASTYIPAPPALPVAQPITVGGSELLALDCDGQQIWAAGGGATSGAARRQTAPCRGRRLPRSSTARAGGRWPPRRAAVHDHRPVRRRRRGAGHDDRVGRGRAVRPERATRRHARVARLQADGAAEVVTLPAAGPGRGAAAKIAFTGPNEGWMVTAAGWLFHYTDGTVYPRNTDPAFAGTITFRPNEAAEQFIPDAPPVDDSELFKPPPVELEQAPAPAAVKRLPALLRQIKRALRGRTLIVRFRLTRRARVQMLGRRKGRTVARTQARMLRPGRHALRLRLEPEALAAAAQLPGARAAVRAAPSAPADGGDTVPTVATATRSPPTATRSPRARAGERRRGPAGGAPSRAGARSRWRSA